MRISSSDWYDTLSLNPVAWMKHNMRGQIWHIDILPLLRSEISKSVITKKKLSLHWIRQCTEMVRVGRSAKIWNWTSREHMRKKAIRIWTFVLTDGLSQLSQIGFDLWIICWYLDCPCLYREKKSFLMHLALFKMLWKIYIYDCIHLNDFMSF